MTTSSYVNRKIGIIGAGKMGSAIYDSLIATHPSENLMLCDKSPLKLSDVHVLTDPQKMAKDCDVIILAIKPENLKKLTLELEKKILISVLAGVSIKTLFDYTESTQIVRTMPNLPIQVGKGIVAWVASAGVKDKEFIRYLLDPMGLEMELQKESLMHSATAISGSGPAYFFYLCEILIAKAKNFGFTADEAQKLAEMTLIGSAALLDQKDQSVGNWRCAVTSKGGTTEAALHYLQQHSFSEIFKQAIEQSKQRSEELATDD